MLEIVEGALEDLLNSVSDEERVKIGETLVAQFAESTRKRALPDLDKRVAATSQDIQKLATSLKFKVKLDSNSVSIIDASTSSTLLRLTQGTDWFEGRPIGDDILNLILKASTK